MRCFVKGQFTSFLGVAPHARRRSLLGFAALGASHRALRPARQAANATAAEPPFFTHIAAVGVPANGRTSLPIICAVLPLVGGDANKGKGSVNDT